MTEAQWLANDDPAQLLYTFASSPLHNRKLRLLAAGYCRVVWRFLTDVRSRRAVIGAEQFADGQVAVDDLRTAWKGAEAAYGESEKCADWPEYLAARATVYASAPTSAYNGPHRTVGWFAADSIYQKVISHPQHLPPIPVDVTFFTRLLRDIFGNPFRPVIFLSEWRTSTAVALAVQMYESRDFSAMPILADALQDAGCGSEEVLSHCRDAKQVHRFTRAGAGSWTWCSGRSNLKAESSCTEPDLVICFSLLTGRPCALLVSRRPHKDFRVSQAKRVLFICEGNRHRSPTAEWLYSAAPGIKARSAGLSDLARVQVTDELLAWADVVFVMERRLRELLRRRFAVALVGKALVCLDVPDDFQFGQPELVAILTERLASHLGAPAHAIIPEGELGTAPDPAT